MTAQVGPTLTKMFLKTTQQKFGVLIQKKMTAEWAPKRVKFRKNHCLSIMVKGQLLENMEPEVFMIKLNQWQLKMEQKLI